MRSRRKPCVAITGANGFLGTALVEYFASQGWQVRALVRKPEKSTTKNIEFVKYDLSQPIKNNILENVDYLLHAAYIKQDRQHPDAFDVNISAAKNLIAAARKQKLKKCLFMSSMSAHEEAVSSYGRQKLAIEKIFSGKGCVSVRAGLIIGNGGIVKQMVDFMRSKHVVPLMGGGRQPLQIVGISDLIATITQLLKSDLYGVYTVATPHVYTYKKFYEAIAKQLKISVLFIPVPFFVLTAAIKVISLLHIPLAVNNDNALGLKGLRSVKTEADLKKIGVNLLPLEDALKATSL